MFLRKVLSSFEAIFGNILYIVRFILRIIQYPEFQKDYKPLSFLGVGLWLRLTNN